LLFLLPFLDELETGVVPLAAPDVATDFALSAGATAGLALLAMQLLAAFVEPPLFVLAERFGRHHFIRGSLLVLGASCLLGAWAPRWWVLLVALALTGPAVGVAGGLGQATLVDARPNEAERVLARWTLFATLGDLATPLLLAFLSWRATYLGAGLLTVLFALLVRRVPTAKLEDEEEVERVTLRQALRQPRVLAWGVGVALCVLLDEPLVAFGAIHLHQRFALEAQWRNIVLAAWMVGGLVGVAWVEVLLKRIAPLRLLTGFALVAVGAAVAFAFAPNVGVAAVALAVLGVVDAPLYPLAKAQAYRALPGQSGTVAAVTAALSPLEMGLPLLVGLVADRAGTGVALALLAVQPAYLALLSHLTRRPRG
jgi:predicted MFS family arabinose efflux permease